MLALGIWASAADASETIWEGEVRVVDATTLARLPNGPVLPLGGIGSPPPIRIKRPAAESRACRELAVQVLRDATAGQMLVCERKEPRSPAVPLASTLPSGWCGWAGRAPVAGRKNRETTRPYAGYWNGPAWFESAERQCNALVQE